VAGTRARHARSPGRVSASTSRSGALRTLRRTSTLSSFLVVDARGEVGACRETREAVRDGEWAAKLPAEKTQELKPGSNRLEWRWHPRW